MKMGIGGALLMLCAAAHGQVTVLGLPLGDVALPTYKVCPPRDPSPNYACWSDRGPSRGRAFIGSLHLPDDGKRPTWAAYATFELMLTASGQVEQIRVRTSGRDANGIVNSIKGRFGLPAAINLNGQIPYADWEHKDAVISLYCGAEYCVVEFRTPAAESARRDESKRRNASRSPTP